MAELIHAFKSGNFGMELQSSLSMFCDAGVERIGRPMAGFEVQKFDDVVGIEPVTHLIQSRCHISSIDTSDTVPGAWILVKATAFPQTDLMDEDVNFCSCFCYNPEMCQGVRVIIQYNDDGTMTFNMYSKSQLLKNMVHFRTSVIKVDFIHAIYQGHLKTMEILTEDGQFDDIDYIPPLVFKSQNVPFVKISSSANGMWMIFKTCDRHEHTWVLLADKALDNPEMFARYKNEYDEVLSSLDGVDVQSMVDILPSDYATV